MFQPHVVLVKSQGKVPGGGDGEVGVVRERSGRILDGFDVVWLTVKDRRRVSFCG